MDDLYKAQKDFIERVRAMSPAVMNNYGDMEILLGVEKTLKNGKITIPGLLEAMDNLMI